MLMSFKYLKIFARIFCSVWRCQSRGHDLINPVRYVSSSHTQPLMLMPDAHPGARGSLHLGGESETELNGLARGKLPFMMSVMFLTP